MATLLKHLNIWRGQWRCTGAVLLKCNGKIQREILIRLINNYSTLEWCCCRSGNVGFETVLLQCEMTYFLNLFSCPSSQVMANVWSVIPTWGRARWCVSVMSVTTAPTRDAVSSAEGPECLMPTTVKSAPSRRKMWVSLCTHDFCFIICHWK